MGRRAGSAVSGSFYFRRLMLAAGAVALPFLALTAFNLHTQQQEAHEAARHQVRQRAEVAAQAVADTLGRAERVLGYLATLPALQSRDAAACNAALRSVVAADPLLNNLGAMDLQGRPLCIALAGSSVPASLLGQPWAAPALQADGLHISDPFFGIVSGRWAVVMTRPLRDAQGRKAGLLAAAIDLREMAERPLSTLGLPKGSALVLLNSQGRLVGSSEALMRWVGQPVVDEVMAHFRSGGAEVFEATGHDGVRRLASLVALPRYGLRVGAGVPADAVLGAARQRLLRDGAAALAILALAVAVGLLGARALNRPIRSLARTARELAEGNLLARADESLPGELGALAAGFNRAVAAHMVSDVAQHAQGLAESASAAKSQFLANMSHEIRTPMNAILGFTDLALRGPLQPRQRDYLLRIEAATGSLLRIVDDILDFSKIEAGRLDLEQTVFRLDELLERCLATVAGPAQRKGLELVAAVAERVPMTLVGDPLRLQQVLLNLCGNAVKFTARGEVELQVARVESDDPGAIRLRFTVRDTGPGLSPEARAQLFEAFGQGDASTTRHHGGSGLGLAISQRLVALMGGEFEIADAVGGGACFSFTACFGACAIEASDGAAPPLAGCRVTVIEAHARTREVWAEALASAGADVSVADGLAAGSRPPAGELVVIGRPADDAPMALVARLAPAQAAVPAGHAPPRVLLVTTTTSADADAATADARVAGVLVKPVLGTSLQLAARRVLVGERPLPSLPGGAGTRGGPAAGGHGEIGTLLRGRRVLVVEDNEFNREVVTDLLADVAGARVRVVARGEDALRAVEQEDFDAVLMDLQMPGMDGFEATRRIRGLASGRGQAPRIVAMTAHALPSDRQRCREAGMDGFIAKPFLPHDLYALLVQQLADRPVAPREGAAQAGAAPGAQPPPERIPVPQEADAGAGVAAAPAEPLPPSGVDIELGLRRCVGRGALYGRIAQRFVDARRGEAERLYELLRLDERDALRALAHAGASTAGSLGAERLRRLARDLEDAILDQRPGPVLAALVAQFDAEHAQVHAALATYLARAGQASGAAG